eukprot:9139368-Alexandrium_andersonii.AAC.1
MFGCPACFDRPRVALAILKTEDRHEACHLARCLVHQAAKNDAVGPAEAEGQRTVANGVSP